MALVTWEFLYRPHGHPKVPPCRGWVEATTRKKAIKNIAKCLKPLRIKMMIVGMCEARQDGRPAMFIPKDPTAKPAFRKIKMNGHTRLIYVGKDEEESE